MRTTGWLLAGFGALTMIWGFFYDASVPSSDGFGSIVNIGLTTVKQMIFQAGSVAFLAGIVLIGANAIVEAVGAIGSTKPAKPAKPAIGEGQV
ncbi:hypothetical protein [Phenylobacterium immobile]|uniref:hypothetical protein n=1 Tax=Phenylobacterium immobile TaxID=21 RepID=UPI000A4E859C|nr:hypothetical protein [Phenylobacterium immobile]